MVEKLKPCPFCGNKKPEVWYESYHGKYFVHCEICHIQFGYIFDLNSKDRYCSDDSGAYETPEEAIAAWNRRPNESKND